MTDYKKVMTKTGLVSLVIGLLNISPIVQAEGIQATDFRVNLNWSFPRSSDNWDGGWGLQGQAVFSLPLMPEHYGFALTIGSSTWDVNDEVQTGITVGNGISGSLAGDSSWTQFGFSFLRSQTLPNGLQMTVETGVLYHDASSDADLSFTLSDNSTSTQELDLSNTVVGLLAADLNYHVNDEMTLYGGIGYQFDLQPGDASAFSDSNKNPLNAVTIRSGIQFKF